MTFAIRFYHGVRAGDVKGQHQHSRSADLVGRFLFARRTRASMETIIKGRQLADLAIEAAKKARSSGHWCMARWAMKRGVPVNAYLAALRMELAKSTSSKQARAA